MIPATAARVHSNHPRPSSPRSVPSLPRALSLAPPRPPAPTPSPAQTSPPAPPRSPALAAGWPSPAPTGPAAPPTTPPLCSPPTRVRGGKLGGVRGHGCGPLAPHLPQWLSRKKPFAGRGALEVTGSFPPSLFSLFQPPPRPRAIPPRRSLLSRSAGPLGRTAINAGFSQGADFSGRK